MDFSHIEKAIEQKLAKRKKKVVNRNAIKALFSAFPGPVAALGKIFLGRQDAIEGEKAKVAQEIILKMLLKIDDAISQATKETTDRGLDWKVIAGTVEAHGEGVREVTGVDVSSDAGPVKFKRGTHIRATGKDADRVTGLRIGGNASEEEGK